MCEQTNDIEKQIKSNEIKYVIIEVLHYVALFLSSGAIIQTFLLWVGVSNTRVEFYTSYVLIFQCAAMGLCALFADKFKKVKADISICRFIFPVFFLLLVAILFSGTRDIDLIYGTVLIGSLILNFALGIYNIILYKLPYYIYPIKSYGRIVSVSGIFASAVGIGSSFLLSLFVSLFDYRIVITVAFLIGAILYLVCAVLNTSYKTIKEEEKTDEKSGSLKDFFSQPVFYKTILPTILRGVGIGIVGLIVSIGMRDEILSTETATWLTIITSVAAVVGNMFYFLIERKIKHRKIMFLSGFLAGIFIPFMTVGKSLIMLYVFYFLGYLSITVIGTAHPVLVYESVDYKHIGRYTAWRMLLMTLGQAIPGFFIGALYGIVGSVGIMTMGALCFLLSSIGLGLFLRKNKETETEN